MQVVFAVATASIAIAGLIVSISARRQVASQRKFEILLERGDRQAQAHRDEIRGEAAAREARSREVTERLDRETARREADTRDVVERIDRRAARRETELRAFLERMDRRFGTVEARRYNLAWRPMENPGLEPRVEPAPKEVRGGRRRATSGPGSGTGETEDVAAQAVPPDEVPE